jgi:hypothetical protein
MRRPMTLAPLLAVVLAFPAAAQQNPFDLALKNLPAYTVDYTMAGDMTGSGRSTSGGNRMASTQTVTGKFFGKSSTSTTWSLTDPEVIWSADIGKKSGTKTVNPLPMMAKAYDDLDAAGRARFHDNMRSMMQFVTRALPGIPLEGQRKGTRTIAGESCEVTEMGSFTFCTMPKLPVTLYSSGSLLCVNYEQTATAVSKSTDAALMEPPAGIKWTEELDRPRADSAARAWVQQLASKELADSLAKARAEYQAATDGGEAQMTPEQQKEMCEALKNFNLGKAMKNAFGNAFKDAAKESLKGGLRGLIRRP